MKYILALSLILSTIAGFPALCQTPQMDVETEIAVIKTEIKDVNEKIDDKFRAVGDRFASLEKNFDRLNNIIIFCIGIPLAVIIVVGATLWSITASRGNRKYQTFENQIETLTEEIEALKRQQIVRS